MSAPHFERVALIGIGLINSSLARVLRRLGGVPNVTHARRVH